uniref:MICOS complex subunit n=1 Tax=Callorhinchus milii TaxID=7868 RepID=A0A4W3IJ85_CALMI
MEKYFTSKVIALATFPSLALASGRVFAQSNRQKKELLKVDQLSLYTVPIEIYRYEEDRPSHLEETISVFRQSAEPYTTWCQGVYTTVKPKIENIVQRGKDSYVFLKNPPPEFYPRAGIIALAGFAGLVLAGRGSRVRKTIYSFGFLATCAFVYYPKEVIEAAKVSGSALYEMGIQGYLSVESLWKENTDKKRRLASKVESSQVEGVPSVKPTNSSS